MAEPKKNEKSLPNIVKEFFAASIDEVGTYLYHEVLVPNLKRTASELVKNGVDMWLYKDNVPVTSSNPYIRQVTQTAGGKRMIEVQAQPQTRVFNKRYLSVEGFPVGSKAEGEVLLQKMKTNIADVGSVSINDMYDYYQQMNPDFKYQSDFTDDKYGWINLVNAKVELGRNGYALKFPEPVAIVVGGQ